MDLEQQFADGRAEARAVPFTDLDVSNDGWSFRGYAAVFDSTADLGDYTEEVARGSVRKGLKNSPNVPMVYDHNMSLPILATTGGGTLRLKEDGRGMDTRTDLPQHFLGEAVRELVRRGDIRGMSFGFVAGAGNSRMEKRNGRPHRVLTGFRRILDVSPTWDPAYQGTSAELRALRAAVGQAGVVADALASASKREIRALTTGQYQNTLEGLQSVAEAVEAALNQVGFGETEPGEQDDDVSPGPFSDQQYADALKTIQSLLEGAEGLLEGAGMPDPDEGEPASRNAEKPEDEAAPDEQRAGVDSAEAEAAARRRRLQMLGLTFS
jgi:HK97 family phage prohead protease